MAMKSPFFFQSGRLPAVVLACLLFAACSTTQKSSTGSGVQDAAPISDAGETPSRTADSAPSGTSASPSGAAPVTGSDASPGSRQSSAAAKGDEEAARLQQQLADQEAEINRLRDEQVNAQRMADEEAARQREVEAAAGTATPGQQAGTASQSETGSAEGSAAAGTVSQAAGSDDAAQSGDEPVAGQPLQRSIYFEYDDATIGDEYDSVVIAHAAFLKANPDFMAEVQGNCDERGSREYNLALGARRAEAVKRGLELAGADGARIKAVSFGAEKPVAFGQDEESYRKNRRADILY
jgi:peptidoglycan-associated lipoprotein